MSPEPRFELWTVDRSEQTRTLEAVHVTLDSAQDYARELIRMFGGRFVVADRRLVTDTSKPYRAQAQDAVVWRSWHVD